MQCSNYNTEHFQAFLIRRFEFRITHLGRPDGTGVELDEGVELGCSWSAGIAGVDLANEVALGPLGEVGTSGTTRLGSTCSIIGDSAALVAGVSGMGWKCDMLRVMAAPSFQVAVTMLPFLFVTNIGVELKWVVRVFARFCATPERRHWPVLSCHVVSHEHPDVISSQSLKQHHSDGQFHHRVAGHHSLL